MTRVLLRFLNWCRIREGERKKPLYWNQTAESAQARWDGGKS